MRAAARVLEVREGRARLECESATAACSACQGGRGCALRWLARPGAPSLEVPVRTGDGTSFQAGDRVTLVMSDGEMLRAVALAYLPPLAGLLGGPLLATRGLGGGEGAALLAAVAGLGIGWAVGRAWLRRTPPGYSVHRAVDDHDH